MWEDCWSSLKFNGAGTLVRRRRQEECEGSRLLREECVFVSVEVICGLRGGCV